MPDIDWLDALTTVAQHAAAVALRYYRADLTVEMKSDGSPVTIADRQAEQAAREWIATYFPHDSIVGEEFGSNIHSTSQRSWFVDPIDGTQSFIRGVPLWGTMIGVTEREVPIAGAVCCPAANELVVAATARGCWHNGSQCAVSTIDDLSQATILTTADAFRVHPPRRARWQALTDRAAFARSWGDCYGYVLVATGRAELMADDRLSLWAYTPLVPIIREAGGVITDWRGQSDRFGSDAIATNRALGETVRDFLCDKEGVPHAHN